MPDASVSFTVKGPPERVFGLSNDLETLGSLIPDVTKVEIADEKNAYWHLTTKIGFVKHTTKLHTTITAMEPPKHADFEGDSDELVLGGSVELSPLPDGSTKVSCELQAHGKGPLKIIIDSLLENRLAKEASGFAENLQKMLLD